MKKAIFKPDQYSVTQSVLAGALAEPPLAQTLLFLWCNNRLRTYLANRGMRYHAGPFAIGCPWQ